MRVINFRGKSKNDGKWVYGHYIAYNFGGTIELPCMQHYIVENFKDHCQLSDRLVEVIPETVGQFTGLKDKNDKEIYEGDIAEYFVCQTHQKPTLGYVDYDDSVGQWRLITTGGSESDFPEIDYGDFKIIGSIHDNPELLEG
jgi:uncharacterized phage protein (TIGR01671 family)